MRLEKIVKPGTTTGRKAFWDAVADLVVASQKVAGKNVSVDVREGYGSVINVNPQRDNSQGIGACCIDGECSLITAAQCSDAGGNFLGIGTTCEDVDCTQGACCIDGDCSLTTEEGCAGEFQGYGTTCDPNPCPGATSGACCHEEVCDIETQTECERTGGIYQGDDTTCDDNPCTEEQSGACCHGALCFIDTETHCSDTMGEYQGDNTSCDPNPCEGGCDCCFTNPDDDICYQVQITVTSGTYFTEIGPGVTTSATIETTRWDVCLANGETTCYGFGVGTEDHTGDFPFHCDLTFEADTVAPCGSPPGFFGSGGLTFTYECDNVPDPGVLFCVTDECDITQSIFYTFPCA